MKRGGGVSGAVSLVMIFCVLCLAVFAVLTIATAKREADLAEMTARSASEYYEADTPATAIAAALRDGLPLPADNVEITSTVGPEGKTAAFTVPMGENQGLEVELLLGGDGTLTVRRWQTVYTGLWEPDDTMIVWDGE